MHPGMLSSPSELKHYKKAKLKNKLNYVNEYFFSKYNNQYKKYVLYPKIF